MTDEIFKKHAPEQSDYLFIRQEEQAHYLWFINDQLYMRFYNSETDTEITVSFAPDTAKQLIDYINKRLAKSDEVENKVN